MKEYPSILGPKGHFGLPCVAFYKYDGSNLRFEWTKQHGWCKMGTRKTTIDEFHPVFGSAWELFHSYHAQKIREIIESTREWKSNPQVTVYCEFFGPTSFAGQHDLVLPNDPKRLVLFDVALYKQGIMSPFDFAKLFVPNMDPDTVAQIVYRGNFTEQFVEDVRSGEKYNLNEGVVVKGGYGHKLWMRKVKTKAYIDKLKSVFQQNWSQYGE